jgi:hypothetical protein
VATTAHAGDDRIVSEEPGYIEVPYGRVSKYWLGARLSRSDGELWFDAEAEASLALSQ